MKKSLCLAAFMATMIIPALAGTLSGPYTDPKYLTAIPFGAHSHWIQPWRAYLDTVPASQFVNGVGICVNTDSENPDVVVRMLAKNGFRNGRIELGWAQIGWDDTFQPHYAARAREVLAACKKYGVRPLILLNGHQGVPGPMKSFRRTVTVDAPVGSRSVVLDNVADLMIGRSGLSDLTDYWAAEALVTSIDGHTVTLSKPLPKSIAAGTSVPMATLKYRPFAVPGSDEFAETSAGWLRYVAATASLVTRALGTENSADKGFDMEIWNELTFGSRFLNINEYYQPQYKTFRADDTWTAIVNATTGYVTQHRIDFAGVRFDDGFANTIPWPRSSAEPMAINAIGKHPYPGRRRYPTDDQNRPGLTGRNALGIEDPYCPTYTALFPEYYWTAMQTETIMRDTAPITTEIYGGKHGHYARPIAPCTVWITEVGIAPEEDGVTSREAALALKAKATLRYLAFALNKGSDKITLYAASSGGDLGFGLLQENFLAYAKTHTAYPTDDRPLTSPAMAATRRLTEAMRVGHDKTLSAPRQLRVDSISDTHDHAQFKGDGTPAHPDLFDREVFAFLPFQSNAHRFVIPYYVMTRDIRTPLPDESFTVTVSGLHGVGTRVTAYDPITDRSVPVAVKARSAESLTIEVSAVDYPRVLTVLERYGMGGKGIPGHRVDGDGQLGQ
ncbi:MAG TPA: hypothetical protein VGK19_08505 [Capsulimonadaceae bacterium]